MNKNTEEPVLNAELELDADRRKFLAACGRFAVVTPPAVTLLLSTSLNSDAIARSGSGEKGGRPRHRPDLPNWLERFLDWLF
ncbi:hypothetical protein [Bradyrhizobium sp. sGM-13]|uniref:hypothetical protein n=1 Tax=Bradyrhizobium sp. sGM-13 TaxID=2831781 RepID=UPI001BCAB984|nr:hypothetical protein [Bradyrhizobium sp. sGM-13]